VAKPPSDDEAAPPLAPGQGVLDRLHPAYDPLGIHLGSFFLYPRFEAGAVYNDNIFATEAGTRGDFVTILAPRLDLRSNWAAHRLDISAGAETGTFAAHGSENYGDYFVGIDGRYDVSEGLALRGGAKYEHLHEDRDATTSVATAAHPVEYDVYSLTTGVGQRLLRLDYEASLEARRQTFDNAAATTGGVLDVTVRNVNQLAPSLRLGYAIAPQREIFLRGAGDIRIFDNSTGGNPALPKQDSSGYRLDLGTSFDLTGITALEFFAGYLRQDYNDPRFGAISGLDFGARIAWNATPLTALSLALNRTVQDNNSTTLSAQGLSLNSPGFLRTEALVTIDHELLRNLLLHAELSYDTDDFVGIDRTDRRIDAALGARYLLNRNLYLGASYAFTRRDSTGSAATGSFSRSLAQLRLGTQL
jgi:hypothetical protein